MAVITRVLCLARRNAFFTGFNLIYTCPALSVARIRHAGMINEDVHAFDAALVYRSVTDGSTCDFLSLNTSQAYVSARKMLELELSAGDEIFVNSNGTSIVGLWVSGWLYPA